MPKSAAFGDGGSNSRSDRFGIFAYWAGGGSTSVVDPEPYPTPATAPDLVTASDTGDLTDNITSDLTPTFAGAGALADARVVVYAGVTALGETTADALGNWTFTPATDLAAGTYLIRWAQGPPDRVSGVSPDLTVQLTGGIIPFLLTHVF